MKIVDRVLDDKSDESLAFFWQIIGPLFVLCTFALAPDNILIFFVGVLGLFLSSKFQMKGFFASLFCLCIAAFAEHFIFKSDHLWYLGLEGSYAVAFFITSLNADRHHHFIKSLVSQLEARSSAIVNLEDDFVKSRDGAIHAQVLLQEKVDGLQKQLDDVLAEQSSLCILNEVLRKTTARHVHDKDALEKELLSVQTFLSSLMEEKTALENKLERMKDESSILSENERLVEEISSMSLEKGRLVSANEALSRLQIQESLRAQSACEQIVGYEEEKGRLEESLVSLKKELESVKSLLEETILERDRYQQLAKRSDEIQTERNFLKDRLKRAEFELAQRPSTDLSLYVPKEKVAILEKKIEELSQIDCLYHALKTRYEELEKKGASIDLSAYVPKEEIVLLQKQVEELSNIELSYNQLKKELEEKTQTLGSLLHVKEEMTQLQLRCRQLTDVDHLYKQLKLQFEEKKQVLHETRRELFHLDTQYQALQLDISHQDPELVSDEWVGEIEGLEKEMSQLQKENEELLQLVGFLSASSQIDMSKRKKKVLTSPDQSLLF